MDREIPVLEGWSSLPVAGSMLQVTRQRLFQMADEDKLSSLRRLPGAGSRPAAYVVGEAELCSLRREQLQAAIRSAQAEDDQATVLQLQAQLEAVQVDATRLLQVQLAAAADAAEVAGVTSLAKLLRTKLAGVQVPAAA